MKSGKEQLWRQVILPQNSNVGSAIQVLNEIALKIVLVTDDKGILIGTISDGDIRRGLLRGLDLTSQIDTIIHRDALVVPAQLERRIVIQMMIANKIQQIPIVDEDMRVIGLHLWDEMRTVASRDNYMVIMAGGKGKRLFPLTANTPKPMLLIAGKPILEHIIYRAKSEGFNNFIIAVNYLGKVIEDYFEDGRKFGVNIQYIRESTPLGTIGALSLLEPKPDLPFILTNGDLMTSIKFSELLDFHIQNEAIASMAIALHEWQHPYGIVKTQGMEIVGFEEKPVMKSYINTGVYALSPEALQELAVDEYCDTPSLFERLKMSGYRTLAFPIHEEWKDVGLPSDLSDAMFEIGTD